MSELWGLVFFPPTIANIDTNVLPFCSLNMYSSYVSFIWKS